MYNKDEIESVSKMLGIKFDKFSLEDLIAGVNVELEHGLINKSTNVTDNELIMTMKIALAHLNEFPNYYNKDYGILKFEEFLKTKKQTNK
ncbi:MAG: DUF5661 family protein [Bacilli bacterium]